MNKNATSARCINKNFKEILVEEPLRCGIDRELENATSACCGIDRDLKRQKLSGKILNDFPGKFLSFIGNYFIVSIRSLIKFSVFVTTEEFFGFFDNDTI